ncbi:MAG: hypothetical protein V4653_17385 [Pseudomonadota bacterium]
MSPAEALGFLRGPTTKDFLMHYIVSIASRTVGPGQFYIVDVPRAQADLHEAFRITEVHAQHGSPPGAHPFPALSVPMRNKDTLVAGIDGLQLPNAGADIMVTGMLTSCAFMYSTNKQAMHCAHIEPTRAPQPPNTNRGLGLAVNLTANQPPFTNDAGGVRYFTRADYEGTHHANLVGVRRGDGWSLYVQGITPNPPSIVFSKQLV